MSEASRHHICAIQAFEAFDTKLGAISTCVTALSQHRPPTARRPLGLQDSSDPLFFVRKMRCVRIWCENFLKAPQGGGKALRAMRACEKFGPSAEKLGSNPILGRFWAGWSERCFIRAQLTLGHSFLSLCCAVVIPLAAYTHSIKSSDTIIAGFCRLVLRN